MSALRSLFKWLVRTERVKQNPVVGLTLPKKTRKLPKFLTIQQVEALLEAPVKSARRAGLAASRAWRDKAILETLYSAGMRIHELVQLNDDDVDVLGEVVRVRGKGKKERLATLGGPAIDALQKYLELRAREHARAAVCEQIREPPDRAQHPANVEEIPGRCGTRSVVDTAQTASQFRDAHARCRRRPAQSPGTPRPRQSFHDANLHTHHTGAAEEGLREGAPKGVIWN